MADPVQARVKAERLAASLRVNLKRRKQAVRERDANADEMAANENPAAGHRPATEQ